MYYDFECKIKDRKHGKAWTKSRIPIIFEIYLKSNYPDILEDRYEYYCGEDVNDWFIGKMSYYEKLFKEIFCINRPLKEDSFTPLYSSCYYCNE